MSKLRKKIDPNQMSFKFGRSIKAYVDLKQEILAYNKGRPKKQFESYKEACIEVAAAINRAIRQSGLSREAVVDGINEYFGWPTTEEHEALKDDNKIKGVKHLSIHIFNHYLSKPTKYPIPAFYLYPIQRVTGSLEPIRNLAEAEEGDVITKNQKTELAMGKLDKTVYELQKLQEELRGAR